jgi:transposase-like protein
MTYSCDFREAVLAYKQKGHTIQQVCKTFNIAKRTFNYWTAQKQKTGTLQPKNMVHEKEQSTPKNYANT